MYAPAAFGPAPIADKYTNTGSTPLATLARAMARGHGGDITLARSDLGGLRALIRLPG